MASDEDDGVGQELLGELCEIHDLGNVREVIAGEADRTGSTLKEQTDEVFARLYLQIDQGDAVTGLPCSRGDELEPQGLKAEVNLGIHERTRMDEQKIHRETSQAHTFRRKS
jgi:hypothetical protein